MRIVLIGILMGLLPFGCRGGIATKPSTADLNSTKNEDAVLKYLRPAFKSSGMGGRIYYKGGCESDVPTVSFPHLNIERPTKGKIDVSVVKRMFHGDKDVKVFGDSEIIRIKIGNVPDEILQTHISLLKFDALDQYTPQGALIAIENNVDVKSAEDKFGYHDVAEFLDFLAVQPADGLPHLPASVKDLTLDQALDMVAKTFSGIVLYGACTRSHLYSIDFSGGFYFEAQAP